MTSQAVVDLRRRSSSGRATGAASRAPRPPGSPSRSGRATSVEPVVQAEPTDAAMPSRSSDIDDASAPSMSRAMIDRRPGSRSRRVAGQLDAGRRPGSRSRSRSRWRRSAADGRGRSAHGQLVGRGQADGAGDVLRAGPAVALLRAAVLLGEDVRAVAHVQGADALGPLELVARRATPGRRRGRRRRGRRTAPPATASTWRSTPLWASDALGDVGERLDRADLVVGEHERDQDRAVVDRRVELVRIDPAVAVDRQLDDLEAELLEVAQRVATAWCSTAEVTIRWPRALPAQATPLSARLIASVPPQVKTISRSRERRGPARPTVHGS